MADDDDVPVFVAHADAAGHRGGALMVVFCGIALTALAVSAAVLGVALLVDGEPFGGAVVLACGLGVGGTALWFGWTGRREFLDEVFRPPSGVVLALTREGVSLGGAWVHPWSQVSAVRVDEHDRGGSDGESVWVPVVVVLGPAGQVCDVTLHDYAYDDEVAHRITDVVAHWAPDVPVTDERRQSPGVNA